MHVLQKKTAPRYKRPDGTVSYLLASARTSDAEHITTSLVEVDPGGRQALHSHRPEQIYFILDGCGEMTVGEETSEVHAGDCIFVPSRASHGLLNNGAAKLRYFSAAAPTFEPQQLVDLWPLGPEDAE
jgi:mannose-6-phosphate isomerase-like protein (cupin superfamily)